MNPVKTLGAILLGLAAIAIPIYSQQPVPPRPSFEVATVKPNASGDNRSMIQSPAGGRFVATGVSLRLLMTFAYRVRDFQISGGPAWIGTDRWDIQAKSEEGSIPPRTTMPDPTIPDPIALRVQSLIDDQFQMKSHRETKELPIYELMIVKDGSKMLLSEDQSPIRPPQPGAAPPPLPPPTGGQRGGTAVQMPRGGMRMGRNEKGEFDLQATGTEMANFIAALSQQVGRPVVDRTELKGLYDIHLEWSGDTAPAATGGAAGAGTAGSPTTDPSGPSIFTAIQEQLGLRLVSTKGPVDIIVIDSVQKPEGRK